MSEAGQQDPDVPVWECAFCDATFSYEPVSIEYQHEQFHFCGWLCVIGRAAIEQNELQRRMFDAFDKTKAKLAESETWLAHYMAGNLGRRR